MKSGQNICLENILKLIKSQKLGQRVNFFKKLCVPLEATFSIYIHDVLKIGYVESKTRSPSHNFKNTWVSSKGPVFIPIFMKIV